MKLLTKKIKKELLPLGTFENTGTEDVPVKLKFFDPYGSWTWYAIEGEEQEDGDWLFFGYVDGDFPELGYFTLSQLESLKMLGRNRIERDMYYEEQTLQEIMD